MNPVTRSLLRRVEDPGLAEFARHWDALEALVVRVYRGGAASADDEIDFQLLRSWFQNHYLPLRDRLRPHWEKVRVGSQTARMDPFVRLTAPSRAHQFVDDWEAMQSLAGAREALNQFLLAVIAGEGAVKPD